jgi:hypothetical protein
MILRRDVPALALVVFVGCAAPADHDDGAPVILDTSIVPQGGGCPAVTSLPADVSGFNSSVHGAYDLSDPCDWYISDVTSSIGSFGTYRAWTESLPSQGIVVPSARLCSASQMEVRTYGLRPAYYTLDANGNPVWHAAAWEAIGVKAEAGTWSSNHCSFPRFLQGCAPGLDNSCKLGFNSPGSPYTILRVAMKAHIYAQLGPVAGRMWVGASP